MTDGGPTPHSALLGAATGGAPRRRAAAGAKPKAKAGAKPRAAQGKAAAAARGKPKPKGKAKGKGAAAAGAKKGARRQRGGGDCSGPPVATVLTGNDGNIALTRPHASDSPEISPCAMKSVVPFAETGLLPERVDQLVFGGPPGPFNLPGVLQTGGRRCAAARCRKCGARL